MPDFSMTRRNLIAAGAASGFLAASGAPFAMAQNAARRTLRVGMSGFPATLDPAMANATAVRRVVTNMFDKLLAFDQSANMALRPALAERWERVSGSALRLFLRKGVMFHDGSPFTAEDVAFSLSPDHLLGPDKAGKTTAMQTLDTIDRVEIIDSHTVIVHTKGDDGLIEKRLASWHSEIVSKRAFLAAGNWMPGWRRRWAPDPTKSSARPSTSISCLPRTTLIGVGCRRFPASISALFVNWRRE